MKIIINFNLTIFYEKTRDFYFIKPCIGGQGFQLNKSRHFFIKIVKQKISIT